MVDDMTGSQEGTAFRARLSKRAFEYCRQVRQSLSECFTYEPDIHAVVNAIIQTGKFLREPMVENIRATFAAEPDKADNQFEAKIIAPALAVCREQKAVLTPLFRYPPDVHMMVNVMIMTGVLDPEQLVNNIRKAYTEPLNPNSQSGSKLETVAA